MIKITSLVFVLTLSLGIMFASIAICEGLLKAFAQDNQTRATSSSSVAARLSGSHITKIKITSPTRGQQLPAGKDLTVYGTSIDNATSNDCKVSVIVNKVRPYQAAIATGPAGATDYSKWKFDITSKYTTIKQGDNRITSKYECANNPDANSFSSVNLTGISDTDTTTTTTTTTTSPLSSNQTNSSTSLPAPPVDSNHIANQQQAANNTGVRNKTAASPLANIPVIGKLFGGK